MYFHLKMSYRQDSQIFSMKIATSSYATEMFETLLRNFCTPFITDEIDLCYQ